MAEISLLAMERFFVLLAVASATLALVIAGARFLAVGARFLDSISPIRVWLAWLIAAVATAGSLYFSENAHLVPCKLCWFQRIAMYRLALLLLIAAVRRDSGIRYYAVPMAAIGAATSAYHYLIEWRPSLSAGSCDAAAPVHRCVVSPIRLHLPATDGVLRLRRDPWRSSPSTRPTTSRPNPRCRWPESWQHLPPPRSHCGCGAASPVSSHWHWASLCGRRAAPMQLCVRARPLSTAARAPRPRPNRSRSKVRHCRFRRRPATIPPSGCELRRCRGFDFDGAPFDIAATGRPKMLVFLAHWVPPTATGEIPVLQSWAAAGGVPTGLDIVGVSTAVNAQRDNYPPSKWVVDKSWTWPVLADSAVSDAAVAYMGVEA